MADLIAHVCSDFAARYVPESRTVTIEVLIDRERKFEVYLPVDHVHAILDRLADAVSEAEADGK